MLKSIAFASSVAALRYSIKHAFLRPLKFDPDAFAFEHFVDSENVPGTGHANGCPGKRRRVFDEMLVAGAASSLAYHGPQKMKAGTLVRGQQDDPVVQEVADRVRKYIPQACEQDGVLFYDASAVEDEEEHRRELIDNTEHTQAYMWVVKEERTAYVAFRGTSSKGDALTNIDIRLESFRDFPQYAVSVDVEGKALKYDCDVDSLPFSLGGQPRVHRGFQRQFCAIERALTCDLLSRARDFDRLVVTGHSLGGALATLAAVAYGLRFRSGNSDVVLVDRASPSDTGGEDDGQDGYHETARARERARERARDRARAREKEEEDDRTAQERTWGTPRKQVWCYTFGSPRVGNAAFADLFEQVLPEERSWRVFDFEDPVPMVPISHRFEHVRGMQLKLGYETGEAHVEGRTKDMWWPLRPLIGLCTLKVVDPIGSHNMMEYVRKLEHVAREVRELDRIDRTN